MPAEHKYSNSSMDRSSPVLPLVLRTAEQAHKGEVWASWCPDLWQTQPFQVVELAQASLTSCTWVAWRRWPTDLSARGRGLALKQEMWRRSSSKLKKGCTNSVTRSILPRNLSLGLDLLVVVLVKRSKYDSCLCCWNIASLWDYMALLLLRPELVPM